MTDIDEPTSEFDYIIVGAGSAGCVLANRLSADLRNNVLLIEAGGDDRPMHNLKQFVQSNMIHIPAGFTRTLSDPEMTWGSMSEPVPGVGGRHFPVIRGKVLGGSSSINAMVYVRGEDEDYDRWSQDGCAGWSWSDVLPYFRRAEEMKRPGDEFHGAAGPLHVMTNITYPAVEKALKTAELMGIPRADSFFCGTQFGGGPVQLNIRKGRRQSTAVAYLNPARRRRNLHIVTNTQVLGITFDGRRASGVHWRRGDGQGVHAANREVILAAGAIGSPQLLELSGVGGAARLSALGITPVVDAPGVGKNLQDHYHVWVRARLKDDQLSSNTEARPGRIFFEILKYLATRRGLLSTSAMQAFIYARSNPEVTAPDLQLSVTPGSIAPPKPGSKTLTLDPWPGFTIGPGQLRPFSRGYSHIKSADPKNHPAIQLAFLEDERDQAVQMAGMKLARAIVNHSNMRSCVVSETSPGDKVQTDDELLAFIKATGSTIYHPVGTVRMGDERAPLDERLRVRGIDGLRVVDASIMPNLVSANTNGPTIMIAEKASDMILEDANR